MPRIRRVSDVDWTQYKNIINDFIDNDSGRQPFLWLRKIEQPLAYGEDSGVVYEPVQLDGLFMYNYIKTWPINPQSLTGELDIANMVLYISARLLSENGFLDDFGYWDYNWSEDRFIVNGKVYKPGGDTQVAQAKDEALLFFVTMKREDPQETENILNSYASPTSRVVTTQGTYTIDSSGKQLRDMRGLPLFIPKGSDFTPSRSLKTVDGQTINL